MLAYCAVAKMLDPDGTSLEGPEGGAAASTGAGGSGEGEAGADRSSASLPAAHGASLPSSPLGVGVATQGFYVGQIESMRSRGWSQLLYLKRCPQMPAPSPMINLNVIGGR